MNRDAKRKPGFYWVRFEGELVVAEYTKGRGCSEEYPHWHVPGSDGCYKDEEVCHLVSGPLKSYP